MDSKYQLFGRSSCCLVLWKAHVAGGLIFVGRPVDFGTQSLCCYFRVTGLPYLFFAYFLGLNFREYPHNLYGQKYGTNVPQF